MIRKATLADREMVIGLLKEYESDIGIDLCFQGFDEELADPFGFYETILVSDAGGCVALRRVDPETCEMKRMFVRATGRGKGDGRRLAEALIAEAKSRGYSRLVLDTMSTMTEAAKLYRSLGFEEMTAYRFNPDPGALYFELDLTPTAAVDIERANS